MRERDFQANLIREIKDILPGAVVLKNDPNYIQGFPDLLVLYKDRWAALEVKASVSSKQQPNQEYYVDILGEMSYAAFISPENKEEILNGLQQTLRARRKARVS